MVIIRLLKRKIRIAFQNLIEKIIRVLPVYYKRLDRISLSRWFDILEGKYIKLYKIKLTSYPPNFFYEVILDMTFQSEHFDLSEIQKQADLAILYSIAARTNNKSMKFQADTMKKEIENKAKKNESKGMKLNDFVDYIEITFDQIGRIDPDKITAARAFSLCNKAVERNKSLQKSLEKHGK